MGNMGSMGIALSFVRGKAISLPNIQRAKRKHEFFLVSDNEPKKERNVLLMSPLALEVASSIATTPPYIPMRPSP